MVLIETYWNVNIIIGLDNISLILVLIETYWNVNPLKKERRKKEMEY